MGITSIALELCNGCGICVDVCPMDVLRMDDNGGKAVIVYPLDCMTCFNCELECDPGAIYVSPERAREVVLPW